MSSCARQRHGALDARCLRPPLLGPRSQTRTRWAHFPRHLCVALTLSHWTFLFRSEHAFVETGPRGALLWADRLSPGRRQSFWVWAQDSSWCVGECAHAHVGSGIWNKSICGFVSLFTTPQTGLIEWVCVSLKITSSPLHVIVQLFAIWDRLGLPLVLGDLSGSGQSVDLKGWLVMRGPPGEALGPPPYPQTAFLSWTPFGVSSERSSPPLVPLLQLDSEQATYPRWVSGVNSSPCEMAVVPAKWPRAYLWS